ncbi:hypothetical protein SprV_0501898800 [Sparganum proliferum]
MPHLLDFAWALFGKAVFSKTGLVCAFHQIPVSPEDISKTAVTTTYGLFKFIRMPFGLRNAAQTFQRFIDHVLRGLPFVYAYLDDLLVAIRNAEERKAHLALVFDCLDKFGVIINPSKCVLGVPSLEFLGHHIDSECLHPLSFKVEMLSGPKGPLELTGEAQTVFERTKNSLTDATFLTQPAPEAQLPLMIDASIVAVCAVLQQHLACSTRPLAFFSKKHLPAETRYGTFSRELLAIYLVVKHFRHFLEGWDCIVFTENKPPTSAPRSHSDRYNPREIAHLDHISQFTTDIRRTDGTKNEVADMLSRPLISSLQLTWDRP